MSKKIVLTLELFLLDNHFKMLKILTYHSNFQNFNKTSSEIKKDNIE